MIDTQSPAAGGEAGAASGAELRHANSLVHLATRRPVAVLMISIAVFVFGLLSLSRLPLDLMPEIAYPNITVRTEYPGAAPEDVEDRVSRRLEQALSVVKDVRRLSSVSRAESSDVILEFAWDTDMKAALQDIREKLDQTFLPDEAERPTILRYDPNLDPVLQIGVVADMDLRRLRELTEEEIERRLENLPGVAAVKVAGGLEEEIRIEVDEDLIRSRGLSVADIARRIEEENLDRASGLLREGDVSYVVRTRNELTALDEMRLIPVRRDGDSVVRLGDVATVTSTHKEQHVITRIGGRPAVKVEIYREAGANIVALADGVRTRLFGSPAEQEKYRKWQEQEAQPPPAADPSATVGARRTTDLEVDDAEGSAVGREKRGPRYIARPEYVVARLPSGVELSVLSDQSVFIESSIRDLRQTALLGGLLAVLVLYFFLGRFAYTLVVALSIPFSVVSTFAPMQLGGLTLNIMSLGGLALGVGMLVDSSIVVLESIFRKRESGYGAFEAAVLGTSEVTGAVFASTLTTVAVFLPIAFVEGVAGQVFRDQALTVVFSLVASLVASLTLIPALAARLALPESKRGRSRPRLFWWPPHCVRTARSFFGAKRSRWVYWLTLPLLLAGLPLFFVADLIGYSLLGIYLLLLFGVVGVGWLIASVGRLLGLAPRWLFARLLFWTDHAYGVVLRLALRHRAPIVALALVSLGVAAWLAGKLGSELIPQVSQGEFTIRVSYPVGTPLDSTARQVEAFETLLAGVPEVAAVATTIGVDPEEVTSSREGDHTARFRLRLERTDESPGELERRVLARVEDIFSGVRDYDFEILRPVLFSFKTPIEVEIRGYELDRLDRLANEVADIVRDVPSLRDVRASVGRGNPEVHLRPNRDRMMKYGITSAEMAAVITQKNTGEVATRFRQGDQKLDVRVQISEKDRASVQNILSLVVAPGRGAAAGWTLRDLIDGWEVREGPAEIRRIDQQRAAVVAADLSGFDLAGASRAIEQRLTTVEIPPNFDVVIGGQKGEMENSRASLLGALLLAVFLVYVVMASQFESLLQPFVILVAIPLSAVGVVATLYVMGLGFSIMSFIGMIVLAGIVVNNAIVLLDLVNRLRSQGHDTYHALIEAGRLRLRPILMTTLTTVLGMIPLTGVLSSFPHPESLDFLLGSGAGAEIRAPLAFTVIGGLLSSTVLTLVVIPVLYSLVSRWHRVRPAEVHQ
ncbi:MAG: efflux RND transporter permease subunit [Planctomycetota bacterium]